MRAAVSVCESGAVLVTVRSLALGFTGGTLRSAFGRGAVSDLADVGGARRVGGRGLGRPDDGWRWWWIAAVVVV